MARKGAETYGRSQNVEMARQDLADENVYLRLYEVIYPEARWFPSSEARLEGPLWVLVPPSFRAVALREKLPMRVWQHSPSSEPVLALELGPAATEALWKADRALQTVGEVPLPDGAGSPRDRAWLREHSKIHPWAWEVVLMRETLRLSQGAPIDAEALRLVAARPPLTAAPWTNLARALELTDPSTGLRLLDRALALDPDYSPALTLRAALLTRLGRHDEARAAREHWLARFRAGAWAVYD